MKTITVNTAKEYPVYIGSGILPKLGEFTETIAKGTAAIISDSNVWPLYGAAAADSLQLAGFNVISYTFQAGEASKNIETYFSILNFLASNKVTRSDVLIALGGGVVGDITGFAAATYLRGIHYVQVPTSLLAMVDSSVGGKTAIDLPAGKNLVGAFYQPSFVLCDIKALSTLPADIFRDGCAEVIKYGILYDSRLFSHLASAGIHFDREYVIARCIELKRDVVTRDEFDTGERQMLNLGHTIGHGIEKQSNFSVSHGQAVAIGTAMICRAAATLNLCSKETCTQICNVLTQFALPVITQQSADALFNCALSDKKRSGGSVNLIIPTEIGRCIIRPTPIEELHAIIEAGLQ